jgi:hypothetical protein
MAYGWAWLRALATVGEGVGTSWAKLPGRVPRRAFSRSARHGPELTSAGERPPGRVPSGSVTTHPRRCCQVGDEGNAESLRVVMASHGTCNSGHVSPCAECRVASGTVFSGGHAMAAKLEVVVDPAVCG